MPNIGLGVDYFRHDGQIQDVAGTVFNTNKSSFLLGAGPTAVFSVGDALYAPLAARQIVRARQADAQATRNDLTLQVAEAYFTVQQARGEVAGTIDALRRADELVKLTEKVAPDLAPTVEVNRAKTEAARRRLAVEAAYERWQVASADLTRLLRLEPGTLVEPAEEPALTVELIDPATAPDDLIPLALTYRPELASDQAVIQAALARVKQEKVRPFVPNIAVRGVGSNTPGLAGGYFGGGINDFLGNFGARFSVDIQAVWEVQNLGFGNRGLVREREAEQRQALLQLLKTQDRVKSEVVQAYSQLRRAANRVKAAEDEVANAVETAEKNLKGLVPGKRVGDQLVLVFRPQEAVAAVTALDQAYRDYYTAVGDQNRAQFRLYRALGHPAQCLTGAPPTPVPAVSSPTAPAESTLRPAAPRPPCAFSRSCLAAGPRTAALGAGAGLGLPTRSVTLASTRHAGLVRFTGLHPYVYPVVPMNPISAALRRPITVMVLIAGTAFAGVLAYARMKVDIFPALNLPVIYVCQPYGGMDPQQMEGLIANYYEYHFLYINGIHHVESKNTQGVSLMKLYFHPGTDMAQAMAETVGYVNRSRAFMPPGTVNPFIMRFDTGSVPVGYLVLQKRNQDDRRDSGPGAVQGAARCSRPSRAFVRRRRSAAASERSSSGPTRERLLAYGLSADDVVQAALRGKHDRAVRADSATSRGCRSCRPTRWSCKPAELGNIEVKPGVFLRDVVPPRPGDGQAADRRRQRHRDWLRAGKRQAGGLHPRDQAGQCLDARRGQQCPRRTCPQMQAVLPDDIKVSFEFDQSPYVTNSMKGVAFEGLLAAALVGLMVLVFLRDWRSVIVVVLNIPLALIAALVALWLSGQTINLMTLGGLALAVGILVDEATVAVENIHVQMEQHRFRRPGGVARRSPRRPCRGCWRCSASWRCSSRRS